MVEVICFLLGGVGCDGLDLRLRPGRPRTRAVLSVHLPRTHNTKHHHRHHTPYTSSASSALPRPSTSPRARHARAKPQLLAVPPPSTCDRALRFFLVILRLRFSSPVLRSLFVVRSCSSFTRRSCSHRQTLGGTVLDAHSRTLYPHLTKTKHMVAPWWPRYTLQRCDLVNNTSILHPHVYLHPRVNNFSFVYPGTPR